MESSSFSPTFQLSAYRKWTWWKTFLLFFALHEKDSQKIYVNCVLKISSIIKFNFPLYFHIPTIEFPIFFLLLRVSDVFFLRWFWSYYAKNSFCDVAICLKLRNFNFCYSWFSNTSTQKRIKTLKLRKNLHKIVFLLNRPSDASEILLFTESFRLFKRLKHLDQFDWTVT